MSNVFDRLYQGSHAITELSSVVVHLVRERPLCDTRTARDLFFAYIAVVQEHLDLVDRHLFQPLLARPEAEVHHTAEDFKTDAREVRRVFSEYVVRWSSVKQRRLVVGSDHHQFVEETEAVLGIVLDHVQREIEGLFPLARQYGKAPAIAA